MAIARALANDPLIVLADEPTASLDTERGQSVMDYLRRLAHERGSAVITVTHDERMIRACDRVGRVRDGRLLDASVQRMIPAQESGDPRWLRRSGVPN